MIQVSNPGGLDAFRGFDPTPPIRPVQAAVAVRDHTSTRALNTCQNSILHSLDGTPSKPAGGRRQAAI